MEIEVVHGSFIRALELGLYRLELNVTGSSPFSFCINQLALSFYLWSLHGDSARWEEQGLIWK